MVCSVVLAEWEMPFTTVSYACIGMRWDMWVCDRLVLITWM